jgi:hypothetical protein
MIKIDRNKISLVLGVASLAFVSCGPARAEGWGGDSSIPLADQLTAWIGYSEMTGDQRDMLAFSVYLFALIFGVLTRMNLGDMAFGRTVNGAIGAAGVCLALYAFGPRYHLFPRLIEGFRFNVTLIACGSSATILLVTAALAKNMLKRNLGQFLDLFGRPDKPKPFHVNDELPPRIATALRKN